MHKILQNLKIQMDHLISAKRPNLVIIKKKTQRIYCTVDFAVPANHVVKIKENEK